MVGQPSFNSRGNSEGGVHAAEVVVAEMERNGRFQVLQLFRVSVGQSRQTPDCHSHSQILRFHVAGGDVSHIGPTVAYFYYRFDHRSRGVPPSGIVLAVIAKQFYDLGEVGLSGENILHAPAVEMESIGCQLETMLWREAATESSQESIRGFESAFAYGVRWNQFCFRVNADKDPSIAQFSQIILAYIALLLATKSPQLIALNALAAKVPHTRIHQPYAALASKQQKTDNRVAMQSRDALRAPNASPFHQQLNRQKCLFFRDCHRAEHPRMFFGVGFATLRAAESLQPIAVLPEFPASHIALGAFHG